MNARPLLLLVAAVALSSSSLSAQDVSMAATQDSASVPTAVPVDTRDTPVVAGPTLAGDRAAVASFSRVSLSEAQRASAAKSATAAQKFNRGQVLMIVGGATILVGSIMDNDPGQIFMIGGAVVFIYGLYLALQQ
jgi:hypothetical protein